MSKRLFFSILIISIIPSITRAQFFGSKNYPQGYFQWPVGAKLALAANFGELRPNHFHMGLDCKTDQAENKPVYAAAEGYISKIKIEPFGFGRAIYIDHPNGLTTLYAHLNDFYPALEKYVTEQQYKQEKWKIFLDIPPGLFKVKKGEFIANSGNTGGSQGPHLHFEIRDTKSDKVLNPLLFGFPIADNIAPQILRLAIYDRRTSTYEQTPRLIALHNINGVYKPAGGNIRVKTDKVSFAITAYDRYTGSTNQNGIFRAELFYNGWAITGFEMDSISYDETRYLNAHIDYKTKANGGPYLQHLSILPGYSNGIYRSAPGEDGVITLRDTAPAQIKIVVTDANFNKSTLEFTLTREGALSESASAPEGPLFKPGFTNVFENDRIGFYLKENCLYDSFHFKYEDAIPITGMPRFSLHNPSVPLQSYFALKIRATVPAADTGHVVMLRFAKNKEDYKKAGFENGWYKASFREFGNFTLIIDTIPPKIMPLGGFNNNIRATHLKKIAFAVTDDTEEIASFTATLDGNWLRFSNDKGKVFQYTFDEHCSPGEHELKIVVKDQVGNVAEKVYRFTR
jgi:hypothetical protein